MAIRFISDSRWRLLAILLTALAAALFVVAKRSRVLAHAGHDHAEIGEFDLDTPRVLSAATAKHIGLKIEEATNRPLEDVLEISGIVRPNPDKHRLVVSRVSGKILAVRVQVGSTVKKGDPLVEVDSPELARNLYEVRKLETDYQKLLVEAERKLGDAARAQASVDSLTAQVDLARTDYDRSKKLSGESLSVRDVEGRKASVVKLEGELKSAQIEIDVSRKEADAIRRQAEALKLSHNAMLAIHNIDPETKPDQQISSTYSIRAEIEGTVISRQAVPGQWVQPGESILTVADYSTVQIEGELPESLIPRVEKRTGDKVRVRPVSDPATVLEGTIKFIAPQLEPVKRTAHVIVDVPNPNGVLRGESWVDLAIVLSEKKKALSVPKSAVVTHGPMHFVFLEIESADPQSGDNAKYQKKDINPGLSSDLFVEVKDGIVPGDRVVTQGAYSLTQLRSKPAAKVAPAK